MARRTPVLVERDVYEVTYNTYFVTGNTLKVAARNVEEAAKVVREHVTSTITRITRVSYEGQILVQTKPLSC